MILIKKSKDKQFYVEITAPNGQVLSVSEMYKQKRSCFRNIRSQAHQFNEANHTEGITVLDETRDKIIFV